MPECELAAYYFPNYHVDPRNEQVHGPGWTEWELVRRARPRFPGHRQPKTPLWGFKDESDPAVFARKIDAAADHGLTAFIFDWYWYDDGPFLIRGLEQGYLRAANNCRLKFALMWANHDWLDIHPARLEGGRLAQPRLLYPGRVSAGTFEAVTAYVVERYFGHSSYWKPDGRPYFSIYELHRLVDGLGGLEAARQALQRFRQKARAAGLEGVHLNAVAWGVQPPPGEPRAGAAGDLPAALGFDSVTSYVWVHHAPLSRFPVTDYADAAQQAADGWRRLAAESSLPYFPNVTMGWDSTPRTRQRDPLVNAGYPFMAMLGGNTPGRFEAALDAARQFVRQRTVPRAITINAWNEWTEGSYLEPDIENRTAYLEAIRNVFGRR